MIDRNKSKSESQYITSSRAAQLSGYSQDYVGQLCRGESIECKRVSGEWQISLETLLAYKQRFNPDTIDKREQSIEDLDTDSKSDIELSQGFVSSSIAAKKTGYSQDYIGQLARSGTVPAKKAGRKWFVEMDALEEHKRHNDGLLAAVQADSVGINTRHTNTPLINRTINSDKSITQAIPIIRYKRDDGSLVPGAITESSADISDISNIDNSKPKAEVLSMPTAPGFSRRDLRNDRRPNVMSTERHSAEDIASPPIVSDNSSGIVPKALFVLMVTSSLTLIVSAIFVPDTLYKYTTKITETIGITSQLDGLSNGYLDDTILQMFESETVYKKSL